MSKPLVFLVDDDPIFRKVTKKLLSLHGYDNVMDFENGEDCVNNLSRKPSLIILDFRLETLNGLDVLKFIKSKQPRAKVVFFSSLDNSQELILKCKAAGAVSFFQKDETGTEQLVAWMDKNVKSGLFSIFS